MEDQKPFVCKSDGCGMSFTNEDHLNVHTKKHAMILHLSLENKADILADQTPTPTRLIRNCDEVGLFDDLHMQHVNPFDETFRRAVESKISPSPPTSNHHHEQSNIMDVIMTHNQEETLHTPHVLPFYNNLADSSYENENSSKDNGKELKQEKHTECIISTLNCDKSKKLLSERIKKQLSLEKSFKKIVDETLSEEILNTNVIIVNTNVLPPPKLILPRLEPVRLLPKLTPILPKIAIKRESSKPMVLQTVPKIVQLQVVSDGSVNVARNGEKKILPKITTDGECNLNKVSNIVRDKLKATLLKSTTNKRKSISEQINAKRIAINSITIDKINNKPVQFDAKLTDTDSNDIGKVEFLKTFERRRAAAKRYRNKKKLWQDETKEQNLKLEAENKRLKAEVAQLKAILLAHRDCSVTKQMALGKNIPIGLPKVIIKNENIVVSNNSSNTYD